MATTPKRPRGGLAEADLVAVLESIAVDKSAGPMTRVAACRSLLRILRPAHVPAPAPEQIGKKQVAEMEAREAEAALNDWSELLSPDPAPQH